MVLPAQSLTDHTRVMVYSEGHASASPSKVSVKDTVTLASQLSVAVKTSAVGTLSHSTVASAGSASTKVGAVLSSTVIVWVCVI